MKIAIVGTGVSGLVAAHLLADDHDVTVFEARDRIGGHVHTVEVEAEGRTWNVDTGFIVFNDRNYPLFRRLLDRIGVGTQPTTMSFGLRCERTGTEYAGTSLSGLFAQRRNLLRPSFLKMVRDIMRFNREAPEILEDPDDMRTLRTYLADRGLSGRVVEHYLAPMGAALWSTEPNAFLDVPARFFVRFFQNHGLLSVDDRPSWYVIPGGSARYVEALIEPIRDRIRTGSPVVRIERDSDGIDVEVEGRAPERFDQVIVAAHSDQALRMLANPTTAERQVLGSIEYQPNDVVLHRDASLMPRQRRAWACWNYHLPAESTERATVTYDMSRLQSLDSHEPFFVSLNRTDAIDPSRVIRRFVYHHPRYTTASVSAQARHAQISGADRIHYCGAYWGNGFHEDGVRSANDVTRSFGREL